MRPTRQTVAAMVAVSLSADQWLTLGVGALGVVGTLGALLIGNVHAAKMQAAERDDRQRARAEADAAHWRIEGSLAIAEASQLLVDANPVRVMFNLPLDVEWIKEGDRERTLRWRALRHDLARIGAHPSDDVARLADQTVVAMHNSLVTLGHLLGARVQHADTLESRKQAEEDHAEAERLLDDLRRALRGVPPEPRIETPDTSAPA